jgi:hypothetical protein
MTLTPARVIFNTKGCNGWPRNSADGAEAMNMLRRSDGMQTVFDEVRGIPI